MTTPQDPSTQVKLKTGVINFSIGQPQIASLPLEQLRVASEHRLAQAGRSWLNYGLEAGDGVFRHRLADFITGHYKVAVSAENIFITGGASHALDFLCAQLTQPGDVVFVEDPTYFLALNILQDYHLTIIPIATDENGLIPAALAAAAQQHTAKFLYTIPTYHNPTGVSIPLERREAIVNLAQTHDFMIVADEVYQMLGYTDTPPPSFAKWLDSEQIISIGSFSKIMAPALRLGWLICQPELQAAFAASGVTASGGGFNHFTANIMSSALELGIQETYLQQLITRYTDCLTTMDNALHAAMPDFVRWHTPHGGFFFWLTLPKQVDTTLLRAKSADFGVGFHAGIKFSAAGKQTNAMRLSFAFYDSAEIIQGIDNLAKLLRNGIK